MVIVKDRPLATLLGDAENVAHTQWQKDSAKFHFKVGISFHDGKPSRQGQG